MQGVKEKLKRYFTMASHLELKLGTGTGYSFWFPKFNSPFLATFPLYSLGSIKMCENSCWHMLMCQGVIFHQRINALSEGFLCWFAVQVSLRAPTSTHPLSASATEYSASCENASETIFRHTF